MHEAAFLRYLSWAHVALSGEPFAFVLNSCQTYIAPLARNKAGSLRIELCFVPAEQRGELQPLDRGCLESLERIKQCLWDENYMDARNSEMRWNHAASAELQEEAWTRLPTVAFLAA
jgi:hypothetical protein